MDEKSPHEKAAESQPRGAHGRFAPKPKPTDHVAQVIDQHTSVGSTKDDKTLIDLKVNNPLRRITELLEEIKRQKAFNFTLKGSLGLMGVALAVSVFGFFGTTNALCDKGVQTQIGTIQVLRADSSIDHSLWGQVVKTAAFYRDFFSGQKAVAAEPERVVLVTNDSVAILVDAARGVGMKQYDGFPVYATGRYDACSQRIRVEDGRNVEVVE